MAADPPIKVRNKVKHNNDNGPRHNKSGAAIPTTIMPNIVTCMDYVILTTWRCAGEYISRGET